MPLNKASWAAIPADHHRGDARGDAELCARVQRRQSRILRRGPRRRYRRAADVRRHRDLGGHHEMMMDPDLKVDVLRLLHGEQDMEFINPIRPGDEITASAKMAAIETKATGETLTSRSTPPIRKATGPERRSSMHSSAGAKARRRRNRARRGCARRTDRHGCATDRQGSDLSLQGGLGRFQSYSR